VFTAFGSPDVEAFVDQPVPEPGPGQLLIKVRAAGVNPVDWKKRTGYRPRTPPRCRSRRPPPTTRWCSSTCRPDARCSSSGPAAGSARRLVEDGHARGKVVIKP
jgi:hypothetical protein